MSWYVHWVSTHPLWSAAAQFAFLGTLGEALSLLVRGKRLAALWSVALGLIMGLASPRA